MALSWERSNLEFATPSLGSVLFPYALFPSVMAIVPKVLNRYKRPAWKPRVQEGSGSLSQSKFGGKPWLPLGEPWPECPNCNEPMQFFMQLNLNTIPESLEGDFGDGLLQLFYCTNDEPDCAVETEAWFPFSKGSLVRIVPIADGTTEAESHDMALELEPFPEKLIVGWDELLDYPDPEEAEAMGADLSDEDWEQLEALEKTGLTVPRDADKLSGWPFWAQSAEYPDCPICAGRMQFIFQIDSEMNLPFSFGDGGCGYLMQCEMHQEQVAFSWASA